ncbi:MAG: endonuclease/exonuclease/phosphatase family protein [Rhizobium sp.]|nr:endonuclease/exonuclease/phosphatase family protein [Rhizobium sp.]
MPTQIFSLTTFNLYNLNEPDLPLYKRSKPWTEDEYALKMGFIARQLREMKADIFAFQELWHAKSLENAFATAKMAEDYDLLVPDGHAGDRIVCAAAVRKGLLVGAPTWIDRFPEDFNLSSKGEDRQTPQIAVKVDRFSRPVLHLNVKPVAKAPEIHIYVCHFKSKGPTEIFREPWYEKDKHSKHAEAVGSALSTIRRTAEATALKMIVTNRIKASDIPAIVVGDVNDGDLSNTINILTGQPRYLMGLSLGGGDADLYTAQTLQQYRSTRDVYYTHIFQNIRESLDQILVSQEFYDNSRKRLWAFDGMDIANDHLNTEDHRADGSNDHGIVRARFRYAPAPKVSGADPA